jgi:hypothetical protein
MLANSAVFPKPVTGKIFMLSIMRVKNIFIIYLTGGLFFILAN